MNFNKINIIKIHNTRHVQPARTSSVTSFLALHARNAAMDSQAMMYVLKTRPGHFTPCLCCPQPLCLAVVLFPLAMVSFCVCVALRACCVLVGGGACLLRLLSSLLFKPHTHTHTHIHTHAHTHTHTYTLKQASKSTISFAHSLFRRQMLMQQMEGGAMRVSTCFSSLFTSLSMSLCRPKSFHMCDRRACFIKSLAYCVCFAPALVLIML